MQKVNIIGAGLAGSEAAFQLANGGFKVTLYEMKPKKFSPAHKSNSFAELVCSNSFRNHDKYTSPIGLLHDELLKMGSLIMESALKHKVPAGSALAVDREGFSAYITEKLKTHPNITIKNEEISSLKDFKDKTIIASGPLTSENLANEILAITGEEFFNFFDAMAPIIYKDSIDFESAWMQSRYDKGEEKAYINCPLTKEEYYNFVEELIKADSLDFKEWEKDAKYFEGCLPVEIMAKRGRETLAFGPMKPIGLQNPKHKEKAYAILQLRQDNALGTLYNMVGFQTKLPYKEQKRIFTMIPALKNANFAKLGGIHKNMFINSPHLLNKDLSLKSNPNFIFAGQITGCEGYIESTSVGFLASFFLLHPHAPAPNNKTAMGAMLEHIVTEKNTENFQPMNINFGLFEPWENKKISRKEKRLNICKRAIDEFEKWKAKLQTS